MIKATKPMNACASVVSFMVFLVMVHERCYALALLNLFATAINLGCVLFTEYPE